MVLEALRRRRIPLGLAMLAAAVWLAAGLRRVGGDGGAMVLDSPFGFLAPRVAAPGWHLVPPGLVRLSAYPTQPATYAFEAGSSEAEPLVSREGIAVLARGTIRYRVDPDRILEVHRELGRRFERESLAPWVMMALHSAIRTSSYGDISGAHMEDLRSQVGQALGERLRAAGLIMLSCDIDSVRIRASERSARLGGAPIVQGMRVLLIGLDGADWNVLDPLIRAGRLPNLARLANAGVRGRLRTITPVLSPVIWTSIATGVLPGRHGIVDFLAATGREGDRIPVTSTLRKVKAIWNLLSESGVSVGIVGWWATYPAEAVNGFIVSDRVAYQLFAAHGARDQPREGKVYPAALDDLVRTVTVAPETLGIQDVARYIRITADPSALPADQSKLIDDFKTLLAAGDTYFQASLTLGQRLRPDFLAFYLEGTDTVAHLFMPYAPPTRPRIDRDAAQRFGRTVEEYYRHADEMVGKLVESIRPTAVVVCSDHGFRTGEDRPETDSRIGYGAAADWHRKYGIIVMAGEPFRRSLVLDEASVLDISPTLLALFGQPTGEDMDGRPIAEAFDPVFLKAHPIGYIPTYEGRSVASGGPVAGPVSGGAPAVPSDPQGDEERKEKLKSLGYLNENTANSHNNRGILLLAQANYDDAIREFEMAIGSKEDLNIARINIARAYYKKKDYAAATEALNQHLKRQPRSKEAENLLGNIAMEQGRLAEAETRFKRALEYDPNSSDVRNSLGLLYGQMGRQGDALREFSRAIEVDKDYAEAYNNIGIIYKNQGRLEDAITAFRRAIAADAEFSGSYSNLALSYEAKGDLKAAEEQFKAALRRDPKSVAVRANYGGLLYLEGRYEDARVELERAVRMDPGYAGAYNNLGAVYGRLGRKADEIAAYRRAEALDPNHADAHHNLGLTLLKQGSIAEGEAELERTLAIDARYAPAYLTLGRHLIGQGRPQAAADLLSRGAQEIPRDADIQELLGEALTSVGEAPKAIEAFERALALRPDRIELKRRIESMRGARTPAGANDSKESPGAPP